MRLVSACIIALILSFALEEQQHVSLTRCWLLVQTLRCRSCTMCITVLCNSIVKLMAWELLRMLAVLLQTLHIAQQMTCIYCEPARCDQQWQLVAKARELEAALKPVPILTHKQQTGSICNDLLPSFACVGFVSGVHVPAWALHSLQLLGPSPPTSYECQFSGGSTFSKWLIRPFIHFVIGSPG